jgi:hypothetical protein
LRSSGEMVNGETYLTGTVSGFTNSFYSRMPPVERDAGVAGNDVCGAYGVCDGNSCCDGDSELLD